MKAIAGLVMLVGGVIFGLWAGIWWAFIGGIVDVISAIRAPELVAMDVAIGVAKIMFAGLIGYLAGILLALPGVALLKNA